jgi:kynurenine formamidase
VAVQKRSSRARWDDLQIVDYIELSHVISDGMPVFPGLERPRITAFLDHEQSRPR